MNPVKCKKGPEWKQIVIKPFFFQNYVLKLSRDAHHFLSHQRVIQCNTVFPWQGYSNISPNGEKWQLYGWFTALWITLHIITFSVQDHIKILHLLHLCMWQRAELPSPRWLIQAVWSSKTHQLLPVEPPSPGATLHLVLLFLFSDWALQTGLDPYKKHSKAGKNYTPQALREACMSFMD